MAYSNTLNFVTGDTLPALNLTLKDKNSAASGLVLDPDNSATWDPINIAGATIKLRLRVLGQTALADTRTMVIVGNGTTGKCFTDFAANTFSAAGTYEGEVEITYANGDKQTVHDLVKFKVREDFD
jgi:hypothetical protein